MITITKKQALEITRDLWTWLAKNPTAEKSDWPQWAKYGRVSYLCGCCEYVIQKKPEARHFLVCHHTDCDPEAERMVKLCPLVSLWPNGCCSFGSPYRVWKESRPKRNYEARRREALKIVAACRKELAKLKSNNTKRKRRLFNAMARLALPSTGEKTYKESGA